MDEDSCGCVMLASDSELEWSETNTGGGILLRTPPVKEQSRLSKFHTHEVSVASCCDKVGYIAGEFCVEGVH